MKKSKISIAVRVLMGLLFVVSGVVTITMMFKGDLPVPPQEGAKTFMEGLAATKYFFPLLKLTETICGLMLILNLFVPMALTVLAPIVINIILFHLCVDQSPGGIVVGLLLVGAEIYLARVYVDNFKGLFVKKA